MNHQSVNPTLLIKRLFGHLYQVVSECVYAVLKLNLGLRVACKFLLMRLLTPFGVGRKWDRPNQPTKSPLVAELRAQGFAELAPMEPIQVESLRRFFCNHVGDTHRRAFADLSDYFERSRERNIQRPPGVVATGSSDCAITQVLFDDYYIDIAAAFMGLDRSRLVASGSMDALIRLDTPIARIGGYDDALELHRDIDSYRFVKMFVYLTDCPLNRGHHEVFLQSHRYTPFALGPIARYTKTEVERAIPEARYHTVEGRAGYAFVENTYAFHRGTKPLTGDRLILNLMYMEDIFLDYYKTAFRIPARARQALSA